MTTSDDRYTHPPEGEDPRRHDDLEAHAADAAGRQTTHDQDAHRDQGLSSDRPGVDASERETTPHLTDDPTYAVEPAAKELDFPSER